MFFHVSSEYLWSWKIQTVLDYETLFWNWNKKGGQEEEVGEREKRKPPLNLSFHQPMSTYVGPPQQALCLNAPGDRIHFLADRILGYLHGQSQVEKWGYCAHAFRSEYREKSKLVLFGLAWLFSFDLFGFACQALLQELPKWQTTMTFCPKRNAK